MAQTLKVESSKVLSAKLVNALESGRRDEILNSKLGVKLAKIELNHLFSSIKEFMSQARANEDTGKYKITVEEKKCVLTNRKCRVEIVWHSLYKNSLKDAALQIALFKRRFTFIGSVAPAPLQSKKLDELQLLFDINADGKRGWRTQTAVPKSLSTTRLADMVVQKFIAI